MNRPRLPCPLFTALVAVATAVQPAVALPPSSTPEPVRVRVVGDAELAGQSGKYFGANMLVGVRVDLVSALHAPNAGSAQATGSLLVRRGANGFEVQVDTHSSASGDPSYVAAAPNGSASGAGTLQVNGIGQVAQIAGDGNRLGNVTTIAFVDSLGGTGFNGQTHAQSGSGPMTAQVTFDNGGVRMDIAGPGAALRQDLASNGDGRILQSGQFAGHGLVGSNQLQLQLMTGAMPVQLTQQLGIQQALAGLRALPR